MNKFSYTIDLPPLTVMYSPHELRDKLHLPNISNKIIKLSCGCQYSKGDLFSNMKEKRDYNILNFSDHYCPLFSEITKDGEPGFCSITIPYYYYCYYRNNVWWTYRS